MCEENNTWSGPGIIRDYLSEMVVGNSIVITWVKYLAHAYGFVAILFEVLWDGCIISSNIPPVCD